MLDLIPQGLFFVITICLIVLTFPILFLYTIGVDSMKFGVIGIILLSILNAFFSSEFNDQIKEHSQSNMKKYHFITDSTIVKNPITIDGGEFKDKKRIQFDCKKKTLRQCIDSVAQNESELDKLFH